MELLLKAVLVAALAVLLHCGPSRALFTRRRLSPATERRIQEEDADGEFEEDSSSLYEEEVNKALERLSGPRTVLLLSSLSGRMVVATDDGGLRSDGTPFNPAAKFISTPVSYNSVKLSVELSGQKYFLGINSGGQIVLDSANSTGIVHEFEMEGTDHYDSDSGTVRLRARVGQDHCYLAFSSDHLPQHKMCSSKSKDKTETLFSIVPV